MLNPSVIARGFIINDVPFDVDIVSIGCVRDGNSHKLVVKALPNAQTVDLMKALRAFRSGVVDLLGQLFVVSAVSLLTISVDVQAFTVEIVYHD